MAELTSRFWGGLLLTTLALTAFAANSILTRMALGAGAIDAFSFSAIRLGSGAAVLAVIRLLRETRGPAAVSGSTDPPWAAAFFLALYAVPFSLAYVRLTTGTGALLLFAAVQVTMILHGLRSGERPGGLEWLGLAGALAGTGWLLAPGVTAPDPGSALLMIAAGAGWGAYSILGRRARDPVRATATNFRRAAIWTIPVTLAVWTRLDLSAGGAVLATISGTVASGVGYVIWYAALKYLSLTRAALVQLAVPVLAALGGVIFVGELITPRLVIAAVVTLGSIALGTMGRMWRVESAVREPGAAQDGRG